MIIINNIIFYHACTVVPSYPQIHGRSMAIGSIRNGQLLCPGQEIVLTCEITGSRNLTWKNSEYIGRVNDSLQFSVLNNTGTSLRSSVHNTTFAVLTSKLLQNKVHQMVSELHIINRADVASTSVSCVDGKGTTNSFSLRSLTVSGIFGNTHIIKYVILYKKCTSSITLSFQACNNWKHFAFFISVYNINWTNLKYSYTANVATCMVKVVL